MAIEQIDVLAARPNAMVLQTPGRKFPGVVLQGDTLKSLLAGLEELTARQTSDEDREAADELCERLRSVLAFYEHTLAQRGIRLPYSK